MTGPRARRLALRALAALAAAAGICAHAALPRLTEWCNSRHDSNVHLVGSESALAAVGVALRDPSSNRALFEALRQPEHGAREWSFEYPAVPAPRLWFNEAQDAGQLVEEIAADPVVAALGIRAIPYRSPYVSDPLWIVPVVMTEYFSSARGHYRYALSDIERSRYDEGLEGLGWRRTGQEILAVPPRHEYASPVRMFRFDAGIYPGSRFFTESPAACGVLRNFDWGLSYAGAPIASPWFCDGPGFIPVERFYNGRWEENASNHRLVSTGDLHAEMIRKGWIPEGRAFCALTPENPHLMWR